MSDQAQFVQELCDLLKKHGVTVIGLDNYDDEENYVGTYYILVGDGIRVMLEDLQE